MRCILLALLKKGYLIDEMYTLRITRNHRVHFHIPQDQVELYLIIVYSKSISITCKTCHHQDINTCSNRHHTLQYISSAHLMLPKSTWTNQIIVAIWKKKLKQFKERQRIFRLCSNSGIALIFDKLLLCRSSQSCLKKSGNS